MQDNAHFVLECGQKLIRQSFIQNHRTLLISTVLVIDPSLTVYRFIYRFYDLFDTYKYTVISKY